MDNRYRCPLCRAEIGLDDANPATDVALCRAGGKVSQFSAVCGAAAIQDEVARMR